MLTQTRTNITFWLELVAAITCLIACSGPALLALLGSSATLLGDSASIAFVEKHHVELHIFSVLMISASARALWKSRHDDCGHKGHMHQIRLWVFIVSTLMVAASLGVHLVELI